MAQAFRTSLLLLAIACLPAAAQSVDDPLSVVEIVPGIHVHAGAHEQASAANENAIGNIGFIVGDEAVLVVDPGGSAREGARLRRAIRAATDRPIRYLVLTHMHPDHVFGAAAFA